MGSYLRLMNLVYHPTPGWRVIKTKKKANPSIDECVALTGAATMPSGSWGLGYRVSGLGFRIQRSGFMI